MCLGCKWVSAFKRCGLFSKVKGIWKYVLSTRAAMENGANASYTRRRIGGLQRSGSKGASEPPPFFV